MAESDTEDRTEAASQRRLQRARSQGNVAVSPELSTLFLLGGAAGLLMLAGPASLAALSDALAGLLRSAGTLDGDGGVGAALRAAAWALVRALAGILAMAVLAGLAATLLQTGFLFSLAKLQPDIARLSPGKGIRRVFGPANLMNAGKSLLKLALIGNALWRLLSGRLAVLMAAMAQSPARLPVVLIGLISSILITAAGVQAAIAVVDLLMVRMRHGRSLRMSRYELKEEAKEADGNPEIKARIRRLRMQRARYRMAQAVARATVVVTNPTHYAVALEYDRARNAAPRVVAKGVDEQAARIRAVAAEHRVPLVANPPLARALYRLDLESDVPPEHYKAVAELIAYVWRLQGQARRRPA
jgi:flagellar biosynthetic protein FlhB